MSIKQNFNHSQSSVAEISWEMPTARYDDDTDYYLSLTPNPVITITYEDGTKTIIDANVIYKRGYDDGVEKTKRSIKNMLGLD
jgi:hypothetical protein